MWNRRFRTRCILTICFCISLIGCFYFGQGISVSLAVQPLTAAAPLPTENLFQVGLQRYQAGDLRAAIQAWESVLASDPEQRLTQSSLTTRRYLAKAYQQIGQGVEAIAQFERLIIHYRQTGNGAQLSRMLIEQAHTLSSLGQHDRAIALLCGNESSCTANSALGIARSQADAAIQAAALGTLGNTYRLQGNHEKALGHLNQSLTIAAKLGNSAYEIAALNGLGNTYAHLAKREYRRLQFATQATDAEAAQRFNQLATGFDRKALAQFERSLALARTQNDSVNELRSLLNWIMCSQRLSAFERQDSDQLQVRIQEALKVLSRLPDSREKVYASIRLTHLLQGTADDSAPLGLCLQSAWPEVVALLHQAVTIAQRLNDPPAQAFALGSLGHLYECRQEFARALTLTQQAQFAAQELTISYVWDWQAGRIFNTQGNQAAAIAAYSRAVSSLNQLRGDIAIASRDLQFDFRDTVEPIYRELAELQLEQATHVEASQLKTHQPTYQVAPAQDTAIVAALKTIDALRLAELQNYLGDGCTLEPTAQLVALIDQRTAVISSIVLGDRVAVILTLPNANQTFRSQVYWLPAKRQAVIALVKKLRLQLEKRSDLTNTYRQAAQQLYDWLIRPIAPELKRAQIETLVFIQDGILRSIPMAALYDGQQFLVEQFAIANTLSLTLVDPTRLDPKQLRVLAFGLTEASTVEGATFFEPLSHVNAEIANIQTLLPGSKGFLDEQFTRTRLQQELAENAYPIVHLATHARFGYDSRETFLVTGQRSKSGDVRSFNQKLTLNEFYQMIGKSTLSNSLELLTLTACETAAGSDRDALGIAGISLQAGVRSAVASLWQVDDQATAELITQFYRSLQQGMGRAKALQQAQKIWLQQHPSDGNHPGYWAALILVGTWL